MTDQTKLRKRLEALLKLPENQVCADCGKRGPRWASANLGVFMCIECSGIHRNLGVHISFVRSVNLDSWTVLQVQFMEDWGNGRANKYYEANVPREYLRPKENDSVRNIERFIRDKYEHKRFIASSPPPKSNTAEEQPIEQPKSRSTVKTSANPAPSVSKPKQVVAPAPAAPEPNLLDFMDAPPPPAPVTNHSFPSAQQQQQSFQQQAPVQSFVPTQQTTQGFTQGGFGDFGPPVSFPGSQSFGGSGGAPAGYLGSPQANGAATIDPFLVPHPQAQPLPPAAPIEQQQQQQQPPTAPKQSADAILSLYSVPPTNYGGPQGGMGGHGMGISMMGGGGGYPGGGPMQMMPMPNQGGGYPRHSMPMGAGGMMMPNPGGYPPASSGYPQQQQQVPIPGYGFPNTGGIPPQQQQPGFPTQQQQQQQQQQQPNMGMGMGMMGHSPANYMNQQSLPRGGGASLPYGQLPVQQQQQQQQHPSYMPQQQQHPGAMGMGLPYSNVQPQAAPYGMMPPNAMQQPPGGGGFPNYGGAR